MLIKSPVPDLVMPEVNFARYILDSLDRNGNMNGLALVESFADGDTFTFAQAKQNIIRCVSALLRLGVSKGDVVMMCCSNCAQYAFLMVGSSACGAVLTTCNPVYTKDELTLQIRQITPTVVFVNDTTCDKIEEIAKDVTSIQHIICFEKGTKHRTYADFIEAGKTIGEYLAVVDKETGKELGPNQVGELWIKGPQVMVGYYKNPTATAETVDADGWLHTGDIGYYDDNQYFYIVDRLKELILYKAFQVAPAELEEVLLRHHLIVDVGVIGVPDLVAGELPKAFVVRKTENLTAEQINHFLKDKVSKFKYLRGGITFVNEIPRSPSGKILRRLLRERDLGRKLPISKY